MKILKIKIKTSQLFRFLLSLFFIVNLSLDINAQEIFKVVLDAGHGGKDPGRPSKNYSEKDIALSIVLLLGKKLEENSDIEVVYTRKKDVFVELIERGNIANKAEANLFISIHCNAHNTQAFGTETYALGTHANERNFDVAKQENSVIYLEENYQENYEGFDPNSVGGVIFLTMQQEEYLDESLLIASYVQDNFRNDLKRVDRGVKQAGFVVLFQTSMPSILIETGFITNKKEGEFLNSESGQDKISQAIYNAIITYKKHLDDNVVIEVKPEPIIEPEKSKDRIFEEVDFKVQIASGTRKLPLKPYNFKGLKDVERTKVGSHYKYYYGKSSNYDNILKLKDQAKEKGYPSAFVVAFKGDERIPLSEVLN